MTDLREQLERSLSGTYTVERELGGGGMSRVFVASQNALSRRVVIKVLPPDMAATVSMERFRREIMLAARLQHPHIVPLLSAGEADSVPYLTMPFVDGETLRARLSRGGELPVAEGVRVLREVATALDYAHEEGIVHRDIKPDNVLLSHGSAMVTDFGVARAISSSSAEEHHGVTSAGIALGTPAYMSPEQAAAAPNVDARADIYAFGVLAYELFAGRPPFTGRAPQALLAAHVSESPEPIEKFRPSLPPSLAALIMRCLAKHPADRPQRASEIVHALDAITTPNGGTPPTLGLPVPASARRLAWRLGLWTVVPAGFVLAIVGALLVRERFASRSGGPVMLAVLPFENQGPASDDYFGDGLADAITSRLASVSALGVIAQRSANQYKHSPKSLNQIGRELGVQYVLQGTVRWQADEGGERKARISPTLVRVSDGTVRWAADPYVVSPVDVFSVQSEIASRVASALDIALSQTKEDSSGSRPTSNAAAYDAYLRGVEYESEYFKDVFDVKLGELAAQQFQRAIHMDTTFALAEAKLGLIQVWQLWTSGADSSRAAPLRESVERAIELSPRLADAYLAKGLLLELVNTDLPNASAALEQALALRPGDAMILALVGAAKATWADSSGLPMLARAAELDPLNALTLQSAVDAFTSYRHFTEAERFAKQWELLVRDNPEPLLWQARLSIASRGDAASAIRLWDAAERISTRPTGEMIRAYTALPQGAPRVRALSLRTTLTRTKFDTLAYYIAQGTVAHTLGLRGASAYGDSIRAIGRSMHPMPGALGTQYHHGYALYAAWLSGHNGEFASEVEAVVSGIARYGARSNVLAVWMCPIAGIYADMRDIPNAIAYGRRCLTLPSGQTTWDLRLSPQWQGILKDPKVQLFLHEFS